MFMKRETHTHLNSNVNQHFAMATKDPLFDYEPGYYEVIKDVWLPGKLSGPKPFGTWTRKAVDAAVNMDLDGSDVLLVSYPKTG